MPVIKCPLESCTYKTPDVDAAVAASLLIIHNNVHINANSSKQKPPKMDRPRIVEIAMKKVGIYLCKSGLFLKIAWS